MRPPLETPKDPRPGDRLGAYELTHRVAEGPFSEIWRAQKADSEGEPRVVALKIARGELGERMLRNELTHQERVRERTSLEVLGGILRIDPVPGTHGVAVMPYCLGGSMRKHLEDLGSPDSRARLLSDLLRIIQTVGALHSAHIVHGDLKPENVLWDEGPVLTDLGLAADRQAWRRERTLSHSMDEGKDAMHGGTLAYMAPEIKQGDPPSQRGDVYALGVMLHEVLFGHRPDRATGVDTVRNLLSPALADILLRALAFDPRQRYASAHGLARDLKRLGASLTATGPLRWMYSAARGLRAVAAAFFVTLRYASVLTLLCTYAWLAFMSATYHPGFVIGLMLFLFLHVFIRWEGPETAEEARRRRA
ncbi:MAG: serine/threonine-protein kinase [Planctomycetota bacterium]|jgi:serine/threonine-protein kinase